MNKILARRIGMSLCGVIICAIAVGFFKMAAFLRHELPVAGDDGERLREIGVCVIGEIDGSGGVFLAVEVAVRHESGVAEACLFRI